MNNQEFIDTFFAMFGGEYYNKTDNKVNKKEIEESAEQPQP